MQHVEKGEGSFAHRKRVLRAPNAAGVCVQCSFSEFADQKEEKQEFKKQWCWKPGECMKPNMLTEVDFVWDLRSVLLVLNINHPATSQSEQRTSQRATPRAAAQAFHGQSLMSSAALRRVLMAHRVM